MVRKEDPANPGAALERDKTSRISPKNDHLGNKIAFRPLGNSPSTGTVHLTASLQAYFGIAAGPYFEIDVVNRAQMCTVVCGQNNPSELPDFGHFQIRCAPVPFAVDFPECLFPR
jgi:hypothetical protein